MTVSPEIIHERLERAEGKEFVAAFDATQVPTAPGCYLMLDAKDQVIYVGKAIHLRNRIRSYLNETDSRYTVKFLMTKVAKIDFLVTTNEKEALLLENSLIKQHKPRYNIQLRDDKTHISLRIDTRQDFPRITVVRRFKKDGARYFGPYPGALAVRQILRQLQRLFPLRTCSDHVLRNRTRPCLYHQLKLCTAPCVKYIDREAYHELVNQAIMVLEGRSAELENKLREEIAGHAARLEFEQAAALRDRLFDLNAMLERQHAVMVSSGKDQDVFGMYTEGRFTEVQVLFYRGGKMLGGRSYSFERCEAPLPELLSSFLLQYYAQAPLIPSEVLVPIELEDADTLGEILSGQREAKTEVACPKRGEKLALVELARRNAKRSFEEKRLAEKANLDQVEQVRQALDLPEPPHRIECFDISTIQGGETVASMVVFQDGQADKARYRHFTMRTVEGQDDFASMREALMRRYSRAIREGDLPELVLIDGGRGQLGVANAVFKDLGIEDLPHVAIAKAHPEKEGDHTLERLFTPGRANPIILPQHGPVILLLTRIRDEAHRFAITHHRKRRSKATLRTRLTDIPGVGPARARTLLNAFGSVAKIEHVPAEEIAALPGFNLKLAKAIHAFVQGDAV
jgi:excinuclease ABC subunit C